MRKKNGGNKIIVPFFIWEENGGQQDVEKKHKQVSKKTKQEDVLS